MQLLMCCLYTWMFQDLTESRSKMGLALPSVPSMAAVTGAKVCVF